MRLLFAGTPETAVPSLAALLASDHDVIGVLTRPDAPAGRGGKMTSSAVATFAREHDLPVLQPDSIRTEVFAEQLRDLAPDAVAVVAYGALIPENLLTVPPHGWINLHFSLLPAWRGAAPVPAAIRAGDEITGATTFVIEKGLDTGPILGTITEEIGPQDTAGALLDRLASSGAHLLVATMDALAAGTMSPQEQSTDGVSHVGKIHAAAAEIDFTLPAFVIDRIIRSLTPDPGAWTQSRWGRLRLGPVTQVTQVTPVTDDDVILAPGEIRAEKRRVLVGTATSALQLSTVQAPGKRAMAAADWARGARMTEGDRFGPESDAELDTESNTELSHTSNPETSAL